MKKYNQSVVIEKVVNGGLGLGRLDDGRIVLVEKALPDEVVAITITKENRQYLNAEIAAIESPHPARIDAPCRWYGRCGGCDFQHCDYTEQLRIKAAIVRDLSQHRFPKARSEQPDLARDTLPSPAQFGYRQRIRLQVDKYGRLGFLGFRSHQIIPIGRCLVAADELNAVKAELNQNPGCAGILRNCREVELLLNPASSKVVCLFHLTRKPRPADIRLAEEITSSIPLVERVFFKGENFPLTGPFGDREEMQSNTLQMIFPPFFKDGAPIILGWEVGGFCQVNLQQNERLIHLVLRTCGLSGDETVLELFCGMGNFSIPIACRAASLLGIEGQGSGIRSAWKNSISSKLTNTTFEKAPIHDACRRLAREGRVFDCVVLDPPRQGVPGLDRELAALTRRNLIYISCDPATLIRDLFALARHGLTIRHIQPVDMFPQTHHIEAVALLEKN